MNPTPELLEAKIIMQGIHVELTEAMRSAITGKFSAVLAHSHAQEIIRIHVRLQRDQAIGHQHHFKATAQAEIGGPDLVASAAGTDAYQVIETLATTLERQLQQRHGRAKEQRHRAGEADAESV